MGRRGGEEEIAVRRRGRVSGEEERRRGRVSCGAEGQGCVDVWTGGRADTWGCGSQKTFVGPMGCLSE